MNCSWVSAPTCTNAMCVNPALSKSRIPATCRWTSGPQGIWADTSSSRTVLDAASNDAGIGSSAFTPAAGEPAELTQCPLHGSSRVGVVRQRDLTDARFPGASRIVEHLAELGAGLDR